MRKALDYLRHQLLAYALKFGVVGLVCFGIDVGIFNLLRSGLLGTGHFFAGPIGAKIASAVISTAPSESMRGGLFTRRRSSTRPPRATAAIEIASTSGFTVSAIT